MNTGPLPVAALLIALIAAPLAAQEGEARLLRFPAIHGDTIAFSYAGNLYTVAAAGGVARRLTNHEGYEMFARFSPDGKQLAFTGQYDGNTEVYVMPAEGGVPRRLTFTATLGRDDVSDRMGPNNLVIGWKNDHEILFRSRMREWNDFIGQLYTVDLQGHLPEQLPVPRGGFASFSPDGTKMAYNRVFREFRTWKRYRGGMADDIWVHDFATKKTEAIASDPAVDDFPMWSGERIYFLSDRDENKRFNLFVYGVGGKKVRQLTHFTDYDVKFPSMGPGAIVFEQAGYIYRFDMKTEKASKVPIRILDDRLGARGGLTDVSKNVNAFEVSPDGKRALFAARGELFTVPAKEGPTRHLTDSTSGIHERNPKWSPDGKHVAYLSDASGEDEIHIRPADGSGPDQQLTSGGPPYKYAIHWSPDSKKILWSDKLMRLFYVEVATKKVTKVAEATAWEIRDYVWSPDSQWIAYARQEEKSMQKVYLYSMADAKSTAVTDGWYDSYRPTFSGDGKYLFFVSERDFNPIVSATEWNYAYVDMPKLFLVTLSKETPSPFTPKADDAPAKEEKKDAKEKEAPKKAVSVKIDLDGIADRLIGLPVPGGNYSNLSSVGSTLYYQRGSRRSSSNSGFYLFDLAQKKETSLGNVGGYEIAANGQKMLVSKDGKYAILDLPKTSVSITDTLDLSGLKTNLDRHAEWKQIFHESWRQMRDFFYDPGLHGVDWKQIRGRYEVLLPHVAHRADLTYVIGEMISELNAGHLYAGAGELPKVHKIQTGLLGAELKRDAATGFFQVKRILQGLPGDKSVRSPLAELGINVREGDYLVAVEGKPTKDFPNVYEALLDTPGKQVRLKVNKLPSLDGAREVTVVPTADEHKLYYHDWVRKNIKHVEEATGGKVGYLHIPDMLSTGLNEFTRLYYPQLRKDGLIIDVRGNGGGNVSPVIIERLRREAAMIKMSRDTAPVPNPQETFLGPMVCLMNEFSASDGDIFPFRFRHYKLGKLIGKRSWGGTIGIRGSLPFVDGGSLNKPEFASYDLEGKRWVIEGHGVDPDIVVDNDPAREFAGTDDQLERAIAEVQQAIRQHPPRIPPVPPFPKR